MWRKFILLALTAVFLLAVGSPSLAHNGEIYIPTEFEPTGDEHPWGGENQSSDDPPFINPDMAGDFGRIIKLFGGISIYGLPIYIHISAFSTTEIDIKSSGQGRSTDVTPTDLETSTFGFGSGDM